MHTRAQQPLRRGRILLVTALALVALPVAFTFGWASWAGVAWLRYGHTAVTERPDTLLAPFTPRYEVAERQERIMDVAPSAAFRATQVFRLEDSRVVSTIFRARERIFSLASDAPAAPKPFLDVARSIGWGVLDSVPGRELIFGAVAQPWNGEVHFRALPPDRFAAFDSAGYAKIIWTMAVDSLGPRRCRVRTETRVSTTDPNSRARFRRYWSVFSPGILLIRYEALRTIRNEAERLERREH